MSDKQAQLAEKLKQLSPEQREALLAKLQAKKSASNIQQSIKEKPIQIVKRQADGLYPLSFAQQRLWFLSQLEDATSAYNIAGGFEIKGMLDVACLERSIQLLIARNEILRTCFIDSLSGPQQKIVDTVDWSLPCSTIGEEHITSTLRAEANTVFDITAAPLFTIKLFQVSETHAVLSLVIHHIISDGWSNHLMLDQLSANYKALYESELSNVEGSQPALHYLDFSMFHHELVNELGEKQCDFWQKALADNEPLNLTADFNRDNHEKASGNKHVKLTLPKHLQGNFEQACHRVGVTSFAAFLALYQLLLSRHSNQINFAVGIPTSGRIHEDTHNLLGFFVNSLAIPCQINDDAKILSFETLSQLVASFIVEAQSNQDIPFEHLVDQSNLERDLNTSPIFQTFFAYDIDDISQSLNIDGLDVKAIDVDLEHNKFDLSLTLKNTPEGIDTIFEYDDRMYSAQRMEAFSQHFIQLVKAFIEDTTQNIFTANMLSEQERAWQHEVFNSTQRVPLAYQTIQEGLLQAADRFGDHLAVSDAVTRLTYTELNTASNQLAHYLLDQTKAQTATAITPDNQMTFAVCLERGINMSLALIASLKAGAAYMPCLSDLPTKRLAYMCIDAQVSAIICDNTTVQSIQSIAETQQLLLINIDTLNLTDYSAVNVNIESTDNTLFNLMYTSGSTGKPKGVMVPQRGIVNRLQWMQRQYPLSVSDSVLQKTPFNFDVSVWELFWPLLQGASLHYLAPDAHKDPQAISATIQQTNITVCHFVPSMLEVFLQVEDVHACSSLTQVFTSGEALLQHQADVFFTTLGHARLSNLYGPTESSIDVTWHDCVSYENSFNNMVSIGKPIDNTQLYVLDRHLQLMPKGSTGDLYIAGLGLAVAYKNLREQTSASFIEHALVGPGQKLYRTGDLARINLQGELDYQGRSDQQVKIRGLRIELGEIEQTLIQQQTIDQAVMSVKEVAGAQQLIAYVVASEVPDKLVLNAQLKQQLPEYMLPFDYMVVDALPLSANGKLNRQLLPEYQASKKAFVAARHDIDAALIAICQELLMLDTMSIEDNFFELGGHSLLATRLLMHIKQRFNIELPLKSVFEMSTIAQLSDFISVLVPVDIEESDSDEDDFEEGVL